MQFNPINIIKVPVDNKDNDGSEEELVEDNKLNNEELTQELVEDESIDEDLR